LCNIAKCGDWELRPAKAPRTLSSDKYFFLFAAFASLREIIRNSVAAWLRWALCGLILCFRSTKSLRSVQRLVNFLRGNRQALDPHAASIFNGIGNRRRRWDICGFAPWAYCFKARTPWLL